MKLRKELWFGFSLMAIVVIAILVLMPWGNLANGHMGLLAFPAMLKAGYTVKVSAGVLTAGGCLGIMIPPSVLLIVYGATAGVSVVQLYAGAFFPGMMLAGIYIAYIIGPAKWKPALMPPLSQSERRVPLPPFAQMLAQRGSNALTGLWRSLTAGSGGGVAQRTVLVQLFVTLLPALFIAAVLGVTWRVATAPQAEGDTAGVGKGRGPKARRSRRAQRKQTKPIRPSRPLLLLKPSGSRRRPGSGSCSASASPCSPSSTGCGTGSGSRCSSCCSPRSFRCRC